MRKWIIVLLCTLFLIAGCGTAKKEEAPAPKSEPNTTHITADDKDISLEVSRQVKKFDSIKALQSQEGYEVVGISVKIENKGSQPVEISPDFVTLITSDGTKYKYSELTSITGKGGFRKVTLPKDYQGGGLLLFEIKKGIPAEKVQYTDKAGHNKTLKLDKVGETNV
ncbi:MAG: DUF4352 domain-containing protein [Bacillota bacterium]